MQIDVGNADGQFTWCVKVHGNTMSEMSPQEFQSEQNVNPITPNFVFIKFSSSNDGNPMRTTFSVMTW
jgi:hypothetical protein